MALIVPIDQHLLILCKMIEKNSIAFISIFNVETCQVKTDRLVRSNVITGVMV